MRRCPFAALAGLSKVLKRGPILEARVGHGTLESWVDFHRAYWDGFKDELPYRTCLVKLDEGPLIISNLVGDDAKTKLGARLSVTFERVTEEIAIPKFALE